MALFGRPWLNNRVSESEVQNWLDNVPNLSATIFRREAYRKAYNVEDKIRAAKFQVYRDMCKKPPP